MGVAHLLLTFALAGAVIGDMVTMFLAPAFLAWYFTPGTGTALCDCGKTVRDVADRMLEAQLIGASVGAATFFVLGIFWARSRKKNAAVAAPSLPEKPVNPS